MSEKVLSYKKGDIISLEDGEYSDYRILAIVVAIVDINFEELTKKFISEHVVPEDRQWSGKPFASDFPAWLVANQYVVPVSCSSCHMGDLNLDGWV